MSASIETPAPAGPQRPGSVLRSPLSLAAYLTWLAIALDPLSDALAGRIAADTPAALALAGLVAVLLLFLLRARREDRASTPAAVRTLVLLQAAAALLAIWGLPHSGSMPVLLILVAAQLGVVFETRRLVLLLVAINAVLAALLITRWSLAAAIPSLLAYAGFQAFAVLTTRYARRAEEARDALGRINAELLATRHLLLESARGEERLRLSRELHDIAGHKLTALKLQLRVLEREAAASQRVSLSECLRLSDELLADIRGVVDTLRAHDGIDLHAALTALAPALPRPRLRLELAADARVSGLDPAQALLRCAQEGLTNALRHSSAETLVLRLMSTAQGVELQIEDDGRATTVPAFGNGLNGMRERLAALGGGLDIETVDGGGLRLCARLPAAVA
jgi:signal transduction histidine kinase